MGSKPRSCRICLDAKLEDLVAFQTDSDWAHLFEFCTGLSVKESNAPQYFCKSCSGKLRKFSDFKNQCLKSDVLWQQIIENVNNVPEKDKSKLNIEKINDDDRIDHSHFDDGIEWDDSFTDTKTHESKEEKQNVDLIDYSDFNDTIPSKDNVTDELNKPQKKETKQPAAGCRKSARTVKPPEKFTISNESPQVRSIEYKTSTIPSTLGITDNIKGMPAKIMRIISRKKESVQQQISITTNKTKIINLNITRKMNKQPPAVKKTEKAMFKKPALRKNENGPKVKITAQNLDHDSTVSKQATISCVDVSDINPQANKSLTRPQKPIAFRKVKIVSYLNEPDTEKAQTKCFKESRNLEVFFSDDAEVDENDRRDSEYDPEDDKMDSRDSDYDLEDEQYIQKRNHHGGIKVKVVKHNAGKPGKEIKLPNDTKFCCGICEFGPTDSEVMKQHWNMHIVKGDLNCRQCPYIGRDMADMAAHRYEHVSPDHKKICLVCFKKLTTSRTLEFHYRSVHLNKKGGICKFCGQELTTFKYLKRHEKCHTNPWICDHCGRNFSGRNSLEEHWSTLLAMKNIICDYCGKGFKTKRALKSHVRSVHIDSKLKCHHCDETFRTKGILKGHLRSLSGPQHFCETCGKGFTTAYNLKVHISVHTKERPHTCDCCQQTFRWKQNLREHVTKFHIKVKSHKCEVCSKAFLLKKELKRHMSMHTGIRPVKCLYEQCDKTFYDRKTMIAHCESKHVI